MARHEEFAEFVLEQLAPLPIARRAMFGANGLYLDGVFFAIVDSGRLYFKTNQETAARYRSRGMATFRPAERYHEVPLDVLEDRAELARWAREAAASAATKPAKRKSAKKPGAALRTRRRR